MSEENPYPGLEHIQDRSMVEADDIPFEIHARTMDALAFLSLSFRKCWPVQEDGRDYNEEHKELSAALLLQNRILYPEIGIILGRLFSLILDTGEHPADSYGPMVEWFHAVGENVCNAYRREHEMVSSVLGPEEAGTPEEMETFLADFLAVLS